MASQERPSAAPSTQQPSDVQNVSPAPVRETSRHSRSSQRRSPSWVSPETLRQRQSQSSHRSRSPTRPRESSRRRSRSTVHHDEHSPRRSRSHSRQRHRQLRSVVVAPIDLQVEPSTSHSPRRSQEPEDEYTPSHSSHSAVFQMAWNLLRRVVPVEEQISTPECVNTTAIPRLGQARTISDSRPLSASVHELFARYCGVIQAAEAGMSHGFVSVQAYRPSIRELTPTTSPFAFARTVSTGISQLQMPSRSANASLPIPQLIELLRRTEDSVHLASFSSLALLALRRVIESTEWTDESDEASQYLLEALEWSSRDTMATAVALHTDCRLVQRDTVLHASHLSTELRSTLRRSTLSANTLFDPSLQATVSAAVQDPVRSLERAVSSLTAATRRGGSRGGSRRSRQQHRFTLPSMPPSRRGRRSARRGRGSSAPSRPRPQQSS